MVHWNAASSLMCLPSSGASLAGAEFVQVIAQPQDDLFRVEHLPGIRRRTMLRAAPALDAGEGLQRVDARHVLAGVEPEILIAGQRRNPAEALRA